jgi:hypothetical protein
MDPIAPLDYERYAVLVNPNPVSLSHTVVPGIASNGVTSIDGIVPSHAYGSSSNRDFQGNRANTGTRVSIKNAAYTLHETFPVSQLSSAMTDRVFRILLNEQNS